MFSDEEEDEEITAPPPVEGAQEEKEEQGEQQSEGKDTRTDGNCKISLKINPQSWKRKLFLTLFDQLCVRRYAQGAD